MPGMVFRRGKNPGQAGSSDERTTRLVIWPDCNRV